MQRAAPRQTTEEPDLVLVPPEEQTPVAGHPMVVLQAKLREPRGRPDWVRRTRLLRALRSAEGAGLVLLDAPAGYGKSTLVAQWKAADSKHFAWVSLDPADNDPVTFWTYVLEAIDKARPTLCNDLIGRANTVQGLRTFVLPRLLNRLAESNEKLVIVLDDYHFIRNSTCHELVGFLVENLPPTTQLVIATRADPPLGIGKLRVDNRLLELRASDLRFDVAEADLLLGRLGSNIETDQVERLLDRTEGWPAGLYLAAVSLKDTDDIEGFLKRFSGDTRILADYLTVEVLERQPPNVRQFLARTSILLRFTAPLASEVAGIEDCEDLLLELEQSNLFVVPLDDRREWYRYHHIFQQLLRSELARSESSEIPNLHRRASAWYRNYGLAGRAAHHAIEAGDVIAAREIIWTNLLPFVNAGRIETVREWLSALGRPTVASDPVLSLAAGWIAGLSGRVDETEEWLALAEGGRLEGWLPDGAPLECGIELLRAVYGRVGVTQALASARSAAACRGLGPWQAIGFFALGFWLHVVGSNTEAKDAQEQAVRTNRGEQPLITTISLAELSMLASDEGDGARAKDLAHEALRVAEEFSLLHFAQSSFVHTALGRVLADAGDFTGALGRLELALTIRDSQPEMSPWPTLQTLIALAPVRFALGDQPGARDVVRRAKSILDSQPDAGLLGDEVTRLERSLGRPSHRPALYGEALTDRELSVLRLLATPLTYREIGESMFISLNTVKSHVRSLYQKLLVSSRTEALAKGRDLGLI
jgi:LuxR family transcriptional regulator, maltose regulon positive regulatory protein